MKDMIIEEFTFMNSMPDLFEHAKNLVLRMNTNINLYELPSIPCI